ncbi:NAD(P)-dependent oxidoreductase [Planococcus sp. N028]|uniref:NAD(P)-dependent oxidoreductase n=1 Tax=Planococcus shixiaomingii TaxID=3058393 RepID=A0ABT8N617_9BACL|nr:MULTISPECIES: NAD(P)-dependent oxidoreductase [unclassified Planococcus (in: firmicutes)]MDN7243184.1 NAD(P)-dependent oxidoreductase [Planococcus sp. N028]WKA55128.1 NAD(P)-dependent oxidoreductase [Planococcus sp. N022]
MKVGIIGATGKAGSLIMKEAMVRGHEVTAIIRNAQKLERPDVLVLEKDVFSLTAEDLKQFDVVVNAFGVPVEKAEQHVEAGRYLIETLKNAPKTRMIVVGAAGSLFVDEAKTTRFYETPEFPETFKAIGLNQSRNLADLEASKGIQWTFLTPAAFFDPEGKRTGYYQSGEDGFIVNSKGESYISYRDYAIALVDEIEDPKHRNKRFTVVSEGE